MFADACYMPLLSNWANSISDSDTPSLLNYGVPVFVLIMNFLELSAFDVDNSCSGRNGGR